MGLPFTDMGKMGAGAGGEGRMTNISSNLDLINPVRLPRAGVVNGRSIMSLNRSRMQTLISLG